MKHADSQRGDSSLHRVDGRLRSALLCWLTGCHAPYRQCLTRDGLCNWCGKRLANEAAKPPIERRSATADQGGSDVR